MHDEYFRQLEITKQKTIHVPSLPTVFEIIGFLTKSPRKELEVEQRLPKDWYFESDSLLIYTYNFLRRESKVLLRITIQMGQEAWRTREGGKKKVQ